MEKTAFKSTCVLCLHISQKLLCTHYWNISNATVCIAGVSIYHNTIFLSFYFRPLCRFCQYIAKIHVYFVIHFTKTITLEWWGMPQNWLFVTKYFFCRIKMCTYKASLITCLHKYGNNSIYLFEPKFTKSRPMLSLKKRNKSQGAYTLTWKKVKHFNGHGETIFKHFHAENVHGKN